MSIYLVTGGAGFIGSHIVRYLTSAGQKVRALDNFSTGSRSNIADIPGSLEVIEGDIRDWDVVRKAIGGVDYVLHLAAQISVPASVDDPATTDEINSRGCLNVLMAARDADVKRFVLSSSCAVYGDNTAFPLKESYAPAPMSPYAVTKLAGEYYCANFHSLYGLPTVALRYFNVFGPGQRPDSQYAAVIPKFCDAVATERAPTVFGDGEQTRDFVYVGNVVQANLLACRSDAAVGKVVNIGSGTRTSLNQLLQTLARIAGKEISANYASPRQGDIRHSVGDISLARELLGYKCSVGLEDGLRGTYEYFTSSARPAR